MTTLGGVGGVTRRGGGVGGATGVPRCPRVQNGQSHPAIQMIMTGEIRFPLKTSMDNDGN